MRLLSAMAHRQGSNTDKLQIALDPHLLEDSKAVFPDGLDCDAPDACDLFEAFAGNQQVGEPFFQRP